MSTLDVTTAQRELRRRRRSGRRDLDRVTRAVLGDLDGKIENQRLGTQLPYALRVGISQPITDALFAVAHREGDSIGAVARRLIRDGLKREGVL